MKVILIHILISFIIITVLNGVLLTSVPKESKYARLMKLKEAMARPVTRFSRKIPNLVDLGEVSVENLDLTQIINSKSKQDPSETFIQFTAPPGSLVQRTHISKIITQQLGENYELANFSVSQPPITAIGSGSTGVDSSVSTDGVNTGFSLEPQPQQRKLWKKRIPVIRQKFSDSKYPPTPTPIVATSNETSTGVISPFGKRQGHPRDRGVYQRLRGVKTKATGISTPIQVKYAPAVPSVSVKQYNSLVPESRTVSTTKSSSSKPSSNLSIVYVGEYKSPKSRMAFSPVQTFQNPVKATTETQSSNKNTQSAPPGSDYIAQNIYAAPPQIFASVKLTAPSGGYISQNQPLPTSPPVIYILGNTKEVPFVSQDSSQETHSQEVPSYGYQYQENNRPIAPSPGSNYKNTLNHEAPSGGYSSPENPQSDILPLTKFNPPPLEYGFQPIRNSNNNDRLTKEVVGIYNSSTSTSVASGQQEQQIGKYYNEPQISPHSQGQNDGHIWDSSGFPGEDWNDYTEYYETRGRWTKPKFVRQFCNIFHQVCSNVHRIFRRKTW